MEAPQTEAKAELTSGRAGRKDGGDKGTWVRPQGPRLWPRGVSLSLGSVRIQETGRLIHLITFCSIP